MSAQKEAEKKSLRPINAKSLFNMTQDNKHLVIIDLRPKNQYLTRFIRKSYNLNPLTDKMTEAEKLLQYIAKIDELAKINEMKYNIKNSKRRIVFIVESSDPSHEEKRNSLANFGMLLSQFDEKYIMSDHFGKFVEKYPFLTFAVPEELKTKSFDEMQEHLMTAHQQELLFANASFPVEVIEDSVYIGKFFHAENKKLLETLKIGVTIDVKKEEKGTAKLEPIESSKDAYLVRIDLDAIIDFDGLVDEIIAVSGDKRILFVGETLEMPAGLVIAYIMKKTKQQVNFASMRVFSALGDTTVDRVLYNQLMNYEPGKITFIKV